MKDELVKFSLIFEEFVIYVCLFVIDDVFVCLFVDMNVDGCFVCLDVFVFFLIGVCVVVVYFEKNVVFEGDV